MSKFESNIKQIAYPQQNVYNMLSDLSNLAQFKDKVETMKDRIPADKIEQVEKSLQDLTFDSDSMSINSPMGEVSMRIVERDEPKTIKFESQNSPIAFKFWIQLLPVTDTTSKMRLTIDADIPFMLKAMVKKPLQEGIEKIADALAMIPYNQ